mgnify:CR=1 FL=1|tara:strand:+ start:87 stop:278 length:192 start_codon:yes stop_codon:yes gene_type:complete
MENPRRKVLDLLEIINSTNTQTLLTRLSSLNLDLNEKQKREILLELEENTKRHFLRFIDVQKL